MKNLYYGTVNWLNRLAFDNTISRTDYGYFLIAYLVIYLVLSFILTTLLVNLGLDQTDREFHSIKWFFRFSLTVLFFIPISYKRLKDQDPNRSSWRLLLLFITFVNIFVLIDLLFRKRHFKEII